ncbi:MAG: hypothetical protein ACR2JE_01870, partial [Acidobacteriaceae bacterium]
EQRLAQVLTALDGMQRRLNDSQQQIEQLRAELQQVRTQLAAEKTDAQDAAAASQAAADLQRSVQQLQDQGEVLQAEVKQHEQTKVESASKYPLRLSGMLLFSSFSNDGAVDNIDLPIVALPRDQTVAHGSLSATLRQTIVALDATGPVLWGAHSAASVRVDFFGGVPYAGYSTTAGTLRLRTAHLNLDWPNHSLLAALDAPLISPLEPTSFVGIGEPALAWSGNLWTWSPQIELMNRASVAGGKLGFDFALIDPAAPGPVASTGLRQPDPSERSRQPGYEARSSYTLNLRDRPFTVGAGGYYSRQRYASGQRLNAWAGSADWNLPFNRFVELSGELYRGSGIGGLGGGVFKDYVFDPDTGLIQGLDAEGGWAQWKARITRSLEANVAIGQDSGFAEELRYAGALPSSSAYANLARNRTLLGNFIFRPKTYLLFSAEYRNIHSWPITGHVDTAQSFGLAAGYLF